MKLRNSLRMFLGTACLVYLPVWAVADPSATTQTNTYGNPGGLIDMPTAEVAPEGQLSTTVSVYGSGNNLTTRTNLSFQVTRRLTGTFRYSGIGGLAPRAGRPGFTTYYDRSLDLRFRFLDERDILPAMSIGLRDFAGTGIYSGEYIVATKSVGKKIKLTGGIGWGRLGSYASFGSTGSRPNQLLGQGGIPTYDRWFRGDVAAFGGLSFQATERLSFAAEYSSDGYPREVTDGNIKRKSPWNFGLNYKVSEAMRVSAYSLYGDEIGASVTLTINAREPSVKGGLESAPLPVSPRDPGAARDLGWTTDPARSASARATLKSLLAREGIALHGLELNGTRAHAQIRNLRYNIRPQAVGRTARAMTRALPASVETFQVTLMIEGRPTSTTTMTRSDLERFENAPAAAMLEAATIKDGRALDGGVTLEEDAFPRFDYNIGPYLRFSVFDPDNPIRADFGVRARGKYYIAPGWVLSGSVSQSLNGNLDNTRIPVASGLPRVRSNVAAYSRSQEPRLDYLTISNFGRPAENLYSRVSLGYLERMYAGVSGEVLWKPIDSPLALGAEVNWIVPREFKTQFGTRTYTTTGGTIPEFNGHVSAYWDMGNGFFGQIDAGRYLAGDWGATVSLDRVFANGWSVGAFATKTDASSTQFGEGSFDKGIKIEIPFAWGIGTPTKSKTKTVLRSLSRDGGARLDLDDRLYDKIKDAHNPNMARTWGKFWR